MFPWYRSQSFTYRKRKKQHVLSSHWEWCIYCFYILYILYIYIYYIIYYIFVQLSKGYRITSVYILHISVAYKTFKYLQKFLLNYIFLVIFWMQLIKQPIQLWDNCKKIHPSSAIYFAGTAGYLITQWAGFIALLCKKYNLAYGILEKKN